MRSCCAIYVDAGYLLSAAATRVTGSSLRSGVTVDHRGLVQELAEQVRAHSSLPLLRTHWYDAAPGRGLLTAEQEIIGVQPGVKLRLGRMSPAGEQKGVDLRLGLDLVSHARSRNVDVAYLVSGDDDLTEAVEEAQDAGVRVVVVAVPDVQGRAHGLAHHLRLAVDEVMLVEAELIARVVTRRQLAVRPAGDPAAAAAAGAGPAQVAVRDVAMGDLAVGDVAARGSGAATGAAPGGAPFAVPTPAALAQRVRGAGAPGIVLVPRTAAPAAAAVVVTPSATAGAAVNGAAAGPAAVAAPAGPRPGPPRTLPNGVPAPHAVPVPPGDGRYANGPRRDALNQSRTVWSTRTGEVAPMGEWPDSSATIDRVVSSVWRVWRSTADDDDVRRLNAMRPSIPADIDRALLMDLSDELGIYDLPDEERFALRRHFWEVVQTESA